MVRVIVLRLNFLGFCHVRSTFLRLKEFVWELCDFCFMICMMIIPSAGEVLKRAGVRADGVAIRGDRKPVKPRYTHGVVCFRPVTRLATRAALYIEAQDVLLRSNSKRQMIE